MLGRIRSFINSSNYQGSLKLIFILALLISLPLILIVAQRQQEIRQRAGGPPITPPFFPPNVSLSLNPSLLTKNVNDTFDVDIILDNTEDNNITGVDFTIKYEKDVLEITNSNFSNSFRDPIINTQDNNEGILRFAATNNTASEIKGTQSLGKVTFRAKGPGKGVVWFENIQVVALNTDSIKGEVNPPGGSYTIAGVPTEILTPTPEPTITVIPPTTTIAPLAGDINGDNSIDILDYNIWRNEFLELVTAGQADLNKDGRIDLLDFAIWRNAFNPPLSQTSKRVFITSSLQDGNLQASGSKWGLGTAINGLDGADKICQGSANAGKLGGTWKAWLSDNNTTAYERLNHNEGDLKLLDGTVFAKNWNDLTNVILQNRPNKTEVGTEVYSNVWTDTAPNGHRGTGMNCQNWTINTTGISGSLGVSNQLDGLWTHAFAERCNNLYRLYCFEQ